jgi:hypothetical protein
MGTEKYIDGACIRRCSIHGQVIIWFRNLYEFPPLSLSLSLSLSLCGSHSTEDIFVLPINFLALS